MNQNNLLEQLKVANPEIFSWSILTGYRGSHSHGTFVPSTDPNSIDDIDLMSVCIPPIDYYFGLKNFGSRGTKEIKEGEWDIVSYELKKFVSLLMKGNPNVIGMLYLKPEHYLKLEEPGKLLIENRELFNSKEVYHSFLGYAKAQFYKMEHLAYEGYMGEKRKGLVQKFGYDCKNAQHLIRLITMCNEWLEYGQFLVYRTTDAQKLIDIKTGKWTLEEVKKEAEKLFAQAQKLFSKVQLQDKANEEEVNYLLTSMLVEQFR